MMAKSLPYWPINPSLAPSPWFTFRSICARALFAVFPAALLWGASFPLAIAAAVVEPGQDAGATGRPRLRGEHGRRDHRLAAQRPRVRPADRAPHDAQRMLISRVRVISAACVGARATIGAVVAYRRADRRVRPCRWSARCLRAR